MRVIFMGTPDFSVGTLEALIAAGHDVCLAVTQPDKPKGRGGKMQYTPVKEKALFYDIPVYQPKRVRDPECVEELRKYHADVIVVIAFGQILPKSILELTGHCFRTDFTKIYPRADALWLHQCTRISAPEIQRRRPDPVGGHRR